MPHAAIVGNLSLDVIAGAEPQVGGSVYHGGKALSRIAPTADVVLVCRCAEHDRALLLPPVEALGFPVAWQPADRTTCFTFHYEGDQRIMRIDDPGDPWTQHDVDGWVGEALGDAPWVLAGGLVRGDFPLETFAAMSARGHRLVLDAQGLVRRRATGALETDGAIDRRILTYVTGLKLNDEEADALCGGTSEEALRTLGVPEVILTLGSRGALILSGDATAHVDATPVDGPVDPTGAGDAFLVAYVSERLRGTSPPEAGRAASRFVSTVIAR